MAVLVLGGEGYIGSHTVYELEDAGEDVVIVDNLATGHRAVSYTHLDVGAKAEVYKLISELAKQGKAILMISSEMQEILQLSDRVYVMCEGHVTGEMERNELDSAKIMTAASTRKNIRKEAVQ